MIGPSSKKQVHIQAHLFDATVHVAHRYEKRQKRHPNKGLLSEFDSLEREDARSEELKRITQCVLMIHAKCRYTLRDEEVQGGENRSDGVRTGWSEKARSLESQLGQRPLKKSRGIKWKRGKSEAFGGDDVRLER